jgi:hypothetical protein
LNFSSFFSLFFLLSFNLSFFHECLCFSFSLSLL